MKLDFPSGAPEGTIHRDPSNDTRYVYQDGAWRVIDGAFTHNPGPNAPLDPELGDLWVDTSDCPPVLKIFDCDGNWIPIEGGPGDPGITFIARIDDDGTPEANTPGHILTAVADNIANGTAPVEYAYKWLVDGLTMGQNKTLNIVQSFVGKIVTCEITVAEPDGSDAVTRTATYAKPIVLEPITFTPVITDDGTANANKVGSILTASAMNIDGGNNPQEYAFDWKSSNVSVGSSKTYTLQSTDVGKIIQCDVTVAEPDGSDAVTETAIYNETIEVFGTINTPTVLGPLNGDDYGQIQTRNLLSDTIIEVEGGGISTCETSLIESVDRTPPTTYDCRVLNGTFGDTPDSWDSLPASPRYDGVAIGTKPTADTGIYTGLVYKIDVPGFIRINPNAGGADASIPVKLWSSNDGINWVGPTEVTQGNIDPSHASYDASIGFYGQYGCIQRQGGTNIAAWYPTGSEALTTLTFPDTQGFECFEVDDVVQDPDVKVISKDEDAVPPTITVDGGDWSVPGQVVGNIYAETDKGFFYDDPDIDLRYGDAQDIFDAELNPGFTLIGRDGAWEQFTFLDKPTVTNGIYFFGGNYSSTPLGPNYELSINGIPQGPQYTQASYQTPDFYPFTGTLETIRVHSIDRPEGGNGVGVKEIYIDSTNLADKIVGTVIQEAVGATKLSKETAYDTKLTLAGAKDLDDMTGEVFMSDGTPAGGPYTQTPYTLTTNTILNVQDKLTSDDWIQTNPVNGDPAIWSSYGTNAHPSYPSTNVFNGKTVDHTDSTLGPNGGAGKYTWSFPAGISFTKIEISLSKSVSAVNDAFKINGFVPNNWETEAGDWTSFNKFEPTFDADIGDKLTSFEIGAWQGGPAIQAIWLDGKMLVDSTVSGTPTGELELTFQDTVAQNPDLQYFEKDDKVQDRSELPPIVNMPFDDVNGLTNIGTGDQPSTAVATIVPVSDAPDGITHAVLSDGANNINVSFDVSQKAQQAGWILEFLYKIKPRFKSYVV